jgi:UDP-N-acetylglucosamine 2-epimerase (non-hydrolysing)
MDTQKIRVLVAFGTRPEVIKLYPIYEKLIRDIRFEVVTATTGQHSDLLEMTLEDLKWSVDINFAIMTNNQSNYDVLSNSLTIFGDFFNENSFDVCLVHGDTTSALGISLAAHSRGIKVGHVEAGLRSGNLMQPWPEESNRRIIDIVSTFKFAPTEFSFSNLKKEGLAENSFITGNTIVDMVIKTLEREVDSNSVESKLMEEFSIKSQKWILVTQHRRESFGAPLRSVLDALLDLANLGFAIVFPVHPNPNVKNLVNEVLSHHSNIHLIDPLPYSSFVNILKNANLVITDSGGMQEECAALNIPLIITRNVTERPEVQSMDNVYLVGSDSTKILDTANFLLSKHLNPLRESVNFIFGDGTASQKILEILSSSLESN